MALRKICFVNTCAIWGGGEKWHLEAALGLDRSRFKVHMLCSPGSVLGQEAEAAGLQVHYFNIGNLSFLNPFKMKKLKAFFVREAFHAVVLNLPADLKSAGPAARRAGTEKVVYRRGSAIPVRDTALNRRLFSKVITHVIANSEATKRTILQNNPNLIDEKRVTVIRNSLDAGQYYVVKHKSKNKIVFGNLGRLVEQKGQDMLVQIAKKIDNTGLDFQLLIGGGGLMHDVLENRIKQAGLDERVSLVGEVAGPAAFMQGLDVFLLPSRWEGFGYVIAEAMASGLPVVAFDVSSNPELVAHGLTGYLAPAFDLGQFAEYALQLARDAKARQDMGRKARGVIEDEYTPQLAIAKLEGLLA